MSPRRVTRPVATACLAAATLLACGCSPLADSPVVGEATGFGGRWYSCTQDGQRELGEAARWLAQALGRPGTATAVTGCDATIAGSARLTTAVADHARVVAWLGQRCGPGFPGVGTGTVYTCVSGPVAVRVHVGGEAYSAGIFGLTLAGDHP